MGEIMPFAGHLDPRKPMFDARFSRSLLACLCLAASAVAVAGDPPHAQVTATDPVAQCVALTQSLPKTLPALRILAPVLSESVSPEASDYCHEESNDCELRTVHMPGLTLGLLVRRKSQEAAPLAARVSSANWNLLGEVRVGQSVQHLEKLYGVKAPPNSGQFGLR